MLTFSLGHEKKALLTHMCIKLNTPAWLR